MGNRTELGQLEQLVLYALLRLGRNAYGVPVRQEIIDRTGKEISVGAVYTVLSRLTDKGYVKSCVGEPTPERGGRAKKYFRITGAGRAALHSVQCQLSAMKEGLPDGVLA